MWLCEFEEYPSPVLSEDENIRTTSLFIYISKVEEVQEKKLIPDTKLLKVLFVIKELVEMDIIQNQWLNQHS